MTSILAAIKHLPLMTFFVLSVVLEQKQQDILLLLLVALASIFWLRYAHVHHNFCLEKVFARTKKI